MVAFSIRTLLAMALLLAVCFGSSAGAEKPTQITVSAASSLTHAFQEIAKAFEKAHPGTQVRLNFGSSGALLQQIRAGAPVDVLAVADQETLEQALKLQLISAQDQVCFAQNQLVLVVPEGRSLPVRKLADLRQPQLRRLAMGHPDSVPLGRYSRRALQQAGLWEGLQGKVVRAQTARQALDYVARGEVDVGIVFATDARLVPGKVKVLFALPLAEKIRYPIAPLRESRHPLPARRFARFLLSASAQKTLAKYGFMRP